MNIQAGNYLMSFQGGGVEVLRDGKVLYFNRRPLYALIKTVLSITEFYDAPYETVQEDGGRVIAEGVLETPTGARLAMRDVYEAVGKGFRVTRTTTVLTSIDDYGFASKLSFVLAASDSVTDYEYFSPTNWYRLNEYSKPYSMGYDKDCEYF